MLADICLPPSMFPCEKIKTIVTLIWYWPFYMFPVSSLSQSGLFAHSLLCVYNVQLFMVAGRKLSTQFKCSPKKRPCMQWLFGFGACCRATGRTVWPQEFVISTGNPERERERAARAYNVAALGRYTSHSITTQPSIWPRYHILILNCLKIILWDKFKSIPPLGGNTCYTWKKLLFFVKHYWSISDLRAFSEICIYGRALEHLA